MVEAFWDLYLACLSMDKSRISSTSLLLCSRGCLGCCAKPQLIIAVDEPAKGLKVQGRAVKKARLAQEFWSSSSSDEMENSGIQSQRSVSSISISNPPLDSQSNTASSSSLNPSEFVNHGLLLWSQGRQRWVGDKKAQNQKKALEPRLSWNATYESLLGSNKPFAQPVPLPEMIDFLVDVWEQEGLYD